MSVPTALPHAHHGLLLARKAGAPVSGNRSQSLGMWLLPRSPTGHILVFLLTLSAPCDSENHSFLKHFLH